MRDPERIPVVLEEIGHIWAKYPDLRLGQLITNAIRHETPELFYIEEDRLLVALQDFDDRLGKLKGGL